MPPPSPHRGTGRHAERLPCVASPPGRTSQRVVASPFWPTATRTLPPRPSRPTRRIQRHPGQIRTPRSSSHCHLTRGVGRPTAALASSATGSLLRPPLRHHLAASHPQPSLPKSPPPCLVASPVIPEFGARYAQDAHMLLLQMEAGRARHAGHHLALLELALAQSTLYFAPDVMSGTRQHSEPILVSEAASVRGRRRHEDLQRAIT